MTKTRITLLVFLYFISIFVIAISNFDNSLEGLNIWWIMFWFTLYFHYRWYQVYHNTILFLWGGPFLDQSKKYKYFQKYLSNYNIVFLDYSQISTIDSLLEEIESLNKIHNFKVIIGFSFWAYLSIKALQKLNLPIKECILWWFLYKYQQLDNIFQSHFKNISSDIYISEYKWPKEFLDLYIKERKEVEAMWYTWDSFFESEFYTNENINNLLLKERFENNKYYELDEVEEYKTNLYQLNFHFLTWKKDNLTPSSNITEFIKETWITRYQILEESCGHSLWSFKHKISELLSFSISR